MKGTSRRAQYLRREKSASARAPNVSFRKRIALSISSRHSSASFVSAKITSNEHEYMCAVQLKCSWGPVPRTPTTLQYVLVYPTRVPSVCTRTRTVFNWSRVHYELENGYEYIDLYWYACIRSSGCSKSTSDQLIRRRSYKMYAFQRCR